MRRQLSEYQIRMRIIRIQRQIEEMEAEEASSYKSMMLQQLRGQLAQYINRE